MFLEPLNCEFSIDKTHYFSNLGKNSISDIGLIRLNDQFRTPTDIAAASLRVIRVKDLHYKRGNGEFGFSLERIHVRKWRGIFVGKWAAS